MICWENAVKRAFQVKNKSGMKAIAETNNGRHFFIIGIVQIMSLSLPQRFSGIQDKAPFLNTTHSEWGRKEM